MNTQLPPFQVKSTVRVLRLTYRKILKSPSEEEAALETRLEVRGTSLDPSTLGSRNGTLPVFRHPV